MSKCPLANLEVQSQVLVYRCLSEVKTLGNKTRHEQTIFFKKDSFQFEYVLWCLKDYIKYLVITPVI